VNSRLHLPVLGFAPYSCSQIKQNCENYLQWINKIKIPQPKKEDAKGSYLAMQNKVMARFNYMKSEHFADGLFPALFNSLLAYTVSLSNQVLSQQSMHQKQAHQSILTKLCCSRILEDKIEDFHQTKPTPLICERSVKIKSRRLNQLLKELINEQQLNHMFPSISYDIFPTDSQNACHIIKTLGDAEFDCYMREYICHANNDNNMLITPNITTNYSRIESLDEHSYDNNNDYDGHEDHEIKEMNTIQNIQEFGNDNNNISISRNHHSPNCDWRNNYELQRNHDYLRSQESRFDPVVELKMISNMIYEVIKKVKVIENYTGHNCNNGREASLICNRPNLATISEPSSNKNIISSPSKVFRPSLLQSSNSSQEFFLLPPVCGLDNINHNQNNVTSNVDISSFNQMNNDISFDNYTSKNTKDEVDNMCFCANDGGNIDRQIRFSDPNSLYPLPNWDCNDDVTGDLIKKDELLYRGVDLSHPNNEALSPFLKKSKTLQDEETITSGIYQMNLRDIIHQTLVANN
jgi:hypothetical protein